MDTASADGLRGSTRATIEQRYRTPEPRCVPALVERARTNASTRERTHALACELVLALRHDRRRAGGVDALMQAFSWSSDEGVALMCLAEALLRTPDAASVDRLIRDKIGRHDWHAHLGSGTTL